MSSWHRKVVNDIAAIVDCMDYYEQEFSDARKELSLKGKLERHTSELPGLFEYRFCQLQEIESILEHLNITLRKKRGEVFRKFLEHYQRDLSSKDCEKYTDTDKEVVDLTMLVNEFALIRNKFLGIIKGFDIKGYTINNVTKLRVAGLDDAEIR